MAKDDSKPYDLEERTFEFAKASRAFVKKLPRTIGNIEDAKQFIRASGSIGANYIGERINREERLCNEASRRAAGKLKKAAKLLAEAGELTKIFGAIVRKSQG